MTVVLDAFALLAYLRQGPGGEVVGMLWAPTRQLGLSRWRSGLGSTAFGCGDSAPAVRSRSDQRQVGQ